jgi:hypothetical protein
LEGRREQQVLALRGGNSETLRMSWMKPMSSIRSASSSTRISMPADRSSVRCWTWSSSRPGVATRISTPRFELRDLRIDLDPAEDHGA